MLITNNKQIDKLVVKIEKNFVHISGSCALIVFIVGHEHYALYRPIYRF